MTLLSFPIWLRSLTRIWERAPTARLSLSALATLPPKKLPKFVQEAEVALKYLQLLGMLDGCISENVDAHPARGKEL
jgi:hypothetical protein